jgi:hypothetical protein
VALSAGKLEREQQDRLPIYRGYDLVASNGPLPIPDLGWTSAWYLHSKEEDA